MKYILLLALFFSCRSVSGQNYILPEGEFMDTVLDLEAGCKPFNAYYYSVNGKYPKSSASLLKEATLFLQNKNAAGSGSGYVTFRFRINCNGKMTKRVQVLQTDEEYKLYHFDKSFVNELFNFLSTLDEWKVPRSKKDEPFSYTAFITFKIQNGKVVNIIP